MSRPAALRTAGSTCSPPSAPGGRGCAGGESLGGLMDRAADADVSRAAADVAGHGRIDVRIARARVTAEERGGGHDLSALAVTALWHVEADPRGLDRLC